MTIRDVETGLVPTVFRDILDGQVTLSAPATRAAAAAIARAPAAAPRRALRISLFGLGYVGAVTSACLARCGHRVLGVDLSAEKLRFIREGKSPILEAGLDEMTNGAVQSGRLAVTEDVVAAVAETDISLICVGTPSLGNGAMSTEYVERVAEQIGQAIRRKGAYHSVVLRSTVLPGTTEKLIVPILDRSTGGRVGETFGISMHPEFLREGKSIHDFYHPPFTIIGTDSTEEYERICSMYAASKPPIGGERIHCSIAAAEAIKYGCNLFHAAKITFANEIGLFCKQAGVDSRQVMQILCRDDKLNISPRYMAPGFAFGGSCLPKDLRAVTDFARKADVSLPMLEAVLASNRTQIDRVGERIRSYGKRRIGLMGISFKEGTDDLRESPMVALAEHLIGKGYDLRIFDPNVRYAALYGSNKAFIDRELPHLTSVLCDAKVLLDHADVVVFGQSDDVYERQVPNLRAGQIVVDLVGRYGTHLPAGAVYDGLYW
jgi:GDP-mannose 6-dehydrogenase